MNVSRTCFCLADFYIVSFPLSLFSFSVFSSIWGSYFDAYQLLGSWWVRRRETEAWAWHCPRRWHHLWTRKRANSTARGKCVLPRVPRPLTLLPFPWADLTHHVALCWLHLYSTKHMHWGSELTLILFHVVCILIWTCWVNSRLIWVIFILSSAK